jgi:hypothetical protein
MTMCETRVRPTTLPSAPDFPDVRFQDVPEMRFFVIDGFGAPGTDPAFQAAIQTVYPAAYTLKYALKLGRRVEVKVGALEALFSFDLDRPVEERQWGWTVMLPIPAPASDADVVSAIEKVRANKSPPSIDALRVERFTEGLAAEITHIGPYDAEEPTIARLHAAVAASGCRPTGRHHEIYISDPGRTAPAKLKTIIRQPIERI